LSSEILARLQQGIRDGVLSVGDKLPSERELAESLGVSRNSVREAIRALEALDVIEVRHGDGTFIKAPDVASLLSPFLDVLLEKQTFLREVLEFRRLVEPAIARLAAERATDEDLERLRRILEDHEARIKKRQAVVDVDIAFHREIAQAAHNSVIQSTLELLSTTLQDFRYLWGEGRPARSASAHRAVFEAIARRDGEAAELAMAEHIRGVEKLVLAELAAASTEEPASRTGKGE
jgi:GntR family transcriptional repressor for pyruvate dehydrogenase complex